MQYDKADQQNCPRRVVFYGRVSTELEAQISALKNQMNWYLELAEHHPNWTVVGQYADEGISGTGMKTRPSFMKMLRDARKKKFDLIVTREVSRFARNTVDTLVTTRELKQYGVEVYFVNDDIWTMRGDGEVRLTIMASLAQDESRKMSERTKAGIQTSQKKGTYVAGPTPFGYKRDEKAHTLVVQESQAETVRKIFAWYADGINGTEIAQTLTQEGAPNKSGMPQWSARQVLSITKNTIYKGYLTYNKSHIDDFLSHKNIKNSEQDYILVKGSFEPIISEKLWDKCQRRRHAWQSYKDGNITQAYLYGKSEHADKWACRLFCGCGARMRAFRAEKGIVRYICYQRSLRNVGCHKVNRKTQKWYLFIQHAHLIFLTAFQPFHQLTLSFGSAHVQKEILWTTYCRAIGSSTFFILLADLLFLNIIGNATFICNHRYRLPFRLDRHDLLHIHQLQHPNVAVIAFYNPVGIPVQKARLYFTIRKRGIIAECSLDAVHI